MDGNLVKKNLFSLLVIGIFFSSAQSVFADDIIPVQTVNSAIKQTTDFSKFYKTSSENLLYLLLSAINEQNYLIKEIQFKTGSVLFQAYSKEFIASVSNQDGINSFIKIIPADNQYNFSPDLINKIHNYIEVNNTINFQKIL